MNWRKLIPLIPRQQWSDGERKEAEERLDDVERKLALIEAEAVVLKRRG